MMRLVVLMIVVFISLSRGQASAKLVVVDRDIQTHISNLVHDDASVRDAAATALVKIGPAVVEPLTKAMEQTDSPEFHGRARQILLLCKPGGAVVDGLQLTLTANATHIGRGEDVTLTTVIKNTTARDINLCVGISFSGVAFEVGSALVASDAHGIPLTAHWTVGFCGTGAYGLNVTIPANGALTYRSPLKVQPWPDQLQREGRSKRILSPGPGHRMIAVPDGTETVRVKMSYSASGPGRGFGGVEPVEARPTNPNARYWSGAIESNELQLAIAK